MLQGIKRKAEDGATVSAPATPVVAAAGKIMLLQHTNIGKTFMDKTLDNNSRIVLVKKHL